MVQCGFIRGEETLVKRHRSAGHHKHNDEEVAQHSGEIAGEVSLEDSEHNFAAQCHDLIDLVQLPGQSEKTGASKTGIRNVSDIFDGDQRTIHESSIN